MENDFFFKIMWMLCSYEQVKGREPVTLQSGFTK